MQIDLGLVLGPRGLKSRALRAWCAVCARSGRVKAGIVQAMLVGKYKETGPRVDRCFATWRRVCVDELPGVMRQLLRMRRRMAQAQADVKADERQARQELTPESAHRLADPLFYDSERVRRRVTPR